MKRSPIKRKTSLNRVSSKRAEELKEYRKLKGGHIKKRPVCEICETNKAIDIHHRLPLGRGGKLCDTTIFVAVCRFCHNYIHNNPAWAEKNNWILRTTNEIQY